MGRKRKMFTTGVVPIGGPRLKSRREARKVTSRFHQLQNEIGEIINSTSGVNNKDTAINSEAAPAAANVKMSSEQLKQVAALEQSIAAMGGRDRYQQASVVTTAHHSTSKWVVSVLNKLGVYPHGKSTTKLQTLEVGAINTQLQKYPGLSVRAIDIHSQHALIEETDFFDILPTSSQDVVVCSMVVNCVDSPTRRGEMLVRLSAQLKANTGLLFLVLPTKCINNEFLSHKQFMQFLKAINLVVPASEPCFEELFPKATTDAPLEAFCSRFTPKLSFFVLIHQPLSIPSPLTCVIVSPVADANIATKAKSGKEKGREEELSKVEKTSTSWIQSANDFSRFIHILKSIKMADHAGLLNHFKPSEHSKQQKVTNKLKKNASVGKFNSSEFSIEIPHDILQSALSTVKIKSKKHDK